MIHLGETPIAVLDVESTGLHPSSDRIVEIAVVELVWVAPDHGYDSARFWSTLVNSECDPGPTFAHGIDASMLVGAPLFSEIKDELARMLKGRILAAHNVNFDAAFLRYEHWRADCEFPPYPLLDTGRIAQVLGLIPPGASKSLAACCEREEIYRSPEHTALGDALATARLLRRYLRYAHERGMDFHDLGVAPLTIPEVRLPKRTKSRAMPRK